VSAAWVLVFAGWLVLVVVILRGFHVLGAYLREYDRRQADRRG
jgi:hypothetical protein